MVFALQFVCLCFSISFYYTSSLVPLKRLIWIPATYPPSADQPETVYDRWTLSERDCALLHFDRIFFTYRCFKKVIHFRSALHILPDSYHAAFSSVAQYQPLSEESTTGWFVGFVCQPLRWA